MSLSMPFNAQANLPGSSAEKFPEEVTYLQGRVEKSQIYQGVISSLCRDAGSSTVTNLRMGLLLGLNASDELVHYDPTGLVANGTQDLSLILALDLSILNNATAADKFTGELYGGGIIDPNKIVLASESSPGIVGTAYEYHIRKLLSMGDFIMEDNLVEPPLFSYKKTVAKTAASTTLTAADRDVQFTNKGAVGNVAFSLPTSPKKDLAFYFYAEADHHLTVTSVTGNDIVGFNDAEGTNAAFSTTGELIGGGMAVIGDGDSWKVHNLSGGVNTITMT